MKKRAISLFLVILFLVSVFSACAPKTSDVTTDAPTDVTTEPPADTSTDSSTDTTTTVPETSPADTTVTDGSSDTATPVVETPAEAAQPETPAVTAPAAAKPATPKPVATKPAAKPATKPTSTKPSTKPVEVKPAEPVVETPAPEETADEALPKASDSPMVTVDKDKVFDINMDKGLLTVRYLLLDADHKSGDSILIHTPGDKFFLIDAGVTESGPQVVQYLKNLGVTKLDGLINTHPHEDHLGGMISVIDSFPVATFYKNPREYTLSGPYNRTITDLNSKNIPIVVLQEGDTIDLGDGLKFDVYNPPKDLDPMKYARGEGKTSEELTEQVNSESLALLLKYNDVKLLFSGDLYTRAEQDMLDRNPEGTFDVDIQHANHHGAGTSSSNSYLMATDPMMVIMSTNGLQSLDIYTKYALWGSVVVANSLNGNILITTDGTKESIHAYVEHQTKPEDGKAIVEG